MYGSVIAARMVSQDSYALMTSDQNLAAVRAVAAGRSVGGAEVAELAGRLVHDPVAAIVRAGAGRRTPAEVAVDDVVVLAAVVALLRAVHDAVAAVRGERASRRAADAIGGVRVRVAVVARLRPFDDAVAAPRGRRLDEADGGAAVPRVR